MKKLLALFILFSLVNNINAQTTIYNENSAWFTLSINFKLTNNFYIANVTQLRRVNFIANTQVFLINPSINYKINKHISVGLGYLLFKSYPYGSYHASIKKGENRIRQHITVSEIIGKVKLSNRFLFEERFKDNINKKVTPNIIDGTTYAQRFRYRLTASFNLFKLKNNQHLLGKISNEIRIRFNSGLSQPDFDQNNLYAYVGYKLLNNSKIWLGYGRDYYKINSTSFITTNILQVAFSYDFDLTKKK